MFLYLISGDSVTSIHCSIHCSIDVRFRTWLDRPTSPDWHTHVNTSLFHPPSNSYRYRPHSKTLERNAPMWPRSLWSGIKFRHIPLIMIRDSSGVVIVMMGVRKERSDRTTFQNVTTSVSICLNKTSSYSYHQPSDNVGLQQTVRAARATTQVINSSSSLLFEYSNCFRLPFLLPVIVPSHFRHFWSSQMTF